MALRLERDDDVAAVHETISRFAASAASNPADRWTRLAGLGFFTILQDFGPVAHAAAAAAMEALGHQGFYGPAADSLVFSALAPDDLAAPVRAGACHAVLGQPPLVPHPAAPLVLVTEIDGEAALFEITTAEPVEMLSGDPWALVTGGPGQRLGPFQPWRDLYALAVSAWMVGAATRLIEDAAEHASHRVQFGQPIGNFQAVSGPLARAVVALDAARLLVDAAAAALDAGTGRLIGAARVSATRAANQAAITAHQTYGAFGVLAEGPVYPRSRRIRQLASQFPTGPQIDVAATLGAGALGLVGTT